MNKHFSVWVLLVAILALIQPVWVNAEIDKPTAKPISRAWRNVAKSSLIVRGRLSQIYSKHVSRMSMNALIICPVETLKGKKQRLPIRIEQTKNITDDIEKHLKNKEVIVFLVDVQNERTNGFHLAEESPPSILASDEQSLFLIRSEISNQKLINESYSSLSISKPDKMDRKIKQLLNELVKSDTQEDSWKELLNLESNAVPALIRSMNDKRNLPWGEFNSFSRTSRDKNKVHFQYSPKVVQDAVSILLNEMTQISFCPTMNGGTAEDRALDLLGWKVWLYYN